MALITVGVCGSNATAEPRQAGDLSGLRNSQDPTSTGLPCFTLPPHARDHRFLAYLLFCNAFLSTAYLA